ncbi:MAG TPA: sensor histidine kinase [Bacillales bacterium]|nr:sensor histidine kinase [Bacillales bacterium]
MVQRDLQYKNQLVSIVMIFILMYVNGLFAGPYLKISLNIVLWLSFSTILFFPKSWWTKKRLVIAVGIFIFESIVGIVWYHEINQAYFLAILILAITIRLSLAKSPIPVMVVMFVIAMLYTKFGHENLFRFISFAILAIVLYLNVRNRMQRNEMYELNKQQLKDLQVAYDQLQEASVTAMQYAVLEERTRIAREIHDAIGHSLTSLIVQMQALRYMIQKDPVQSEKSLEEMLVVARLGLQEIRTSVHSLADDRSKSGITPLKALLSRMEASASIRYTFHSEIKDDELEPDVSGILFRVLQEAITNVIRHSEASLVDVSLKKERNRIIIQIRDNGIMESCQNVNEGFGLKMMRERIEERGGHLFYSILEPQGFEIIAEIPLEDMEG